MALHLFLAFLLWPSSAEATSVLARMAALPLFLAGPSSSHDLSSAPRASPLAFVQRSASALEAHAEHEHAVGDEGAVASAPTSESSPPNPFEKTVRSVTRNKNYKFGDLSKKVLRTSKTGVEAAVRTVKPGASVVGCKCPTTTFLAHRPCPARLRIRRPYNGNYQCNDKGCGTHRSEASSGREVRGWYLTYSRVAFDRVQRLIAIPVRGSDQRRNQPRGQDHDLL